MRKISRLLGEVFVVFMSILVLQLSLRLGHDVAAAVPSRWSDPAAVLGILIIMGALGGLIARQYAREGLHETVLGQVLSREWFPVLIIFLLLFATTFLCDVWS